ncbi:MAG: hypothetical protein IJO71_02690 [Microbacterium sp.]|uniref:gp53-like domain-containing protein n=1 Tax=Microbacterium sp. TaxID=51671 RepID=UPI0025D0F35C|nr:hypothetical protein [Microbacterium sp.]MBQ9916090.1 hypothetical protein [Microbacterium sp.]
MALDSKKHATLAPGEAPSRAGLAKSLLSVNDIVPVANATEQAQVVDALSATDFPVTSSRPLTTARGDARGLHTIEVSRGDGVFIPASGVPSFTSKANADTWAAAHSSLLNVGDRCVAGPADFRWDGAAWRPTARISGYQAGPNPGPQPSLITQAGTAVGTVAADGTGMNVGFPSAFPNGVITVVVTNGDASPSATDRVRGAANVTLSTFGVVWENVTGGGGLRRANWIAIGW